MIIAKYPSASHLQELLRRPVINLVELETTVSAILQKVKSGGDEALRKFGLQFDKVDIDYFTVTVEEFEEAEKLVSPQLKVAISLAANNIETFHAQQRENFLPIETMPGVRCWRKSLAVERVGLYVPGGTAPLFSTVLMLGIPARIAGCRNISLCTPPGKDGKVHPAILYTAKMVGIHKVFKLGGAQAIGALAYGTETIPKVDKIFGPGNRYVTCAKMLVQKDGIAIDMPAGPSEVLVFADSACVPAFVAADLLSQAEHDVDSQVVLLTTSDEVLEQVQKEIAEQSALLARQELLAKSLSHSLGILLKNEMEVLEAINSYAPEHLILACKNAEALAELVINAGSVFLGNYSPESAGDYASGTNHTLPTGGFARSYSGVSLDSFTKKITFQLISREGLERLGPSIITMAEAEQLTAHARAVELRLKQNSFVDP